MLLQLKFFMIRYLCQEIAIITNMRPLVPEMKVCDKIKVRYLTVLHVAYLKQIKAYESESQSWSPAVFFRIPIIFLRENVL